MQIYYSKRARKQLRQLDRQIKTRIDDKIRAYAADPATQANNVKQISSSGGHRHRLRVGDYRVLFRVDDGATKIMFIYRIAHRREAYDG